MKLDPNMWSTHSREARCNLAPSGGEKVSRMAIGIDNSHISHVEKPWKESSERDAFELQAKNTHLNFHGFCFVSVSMMHTLLFLVELLDPLLWPRFVWSTSAQRRGSKMDS